jgi:hypothetical protein
MVDFDPLLFSLSFAWLLSVSFSLSLYLAKRSRKISLSHYYFSSSLTRDKSLSLSYYPCGATYLLFPFLPSQLLSLPLGTLFKSLSVRASLVSYYKTWYCSPNTRTKQSSVNEPALTLLLLLLLLHLLRHVMVFFPYLP